MVGRALAKWPRLFAAVREVRSAFDLGMGTDVAAAPRCDALHAVVSELSLRFGSRAAGGTG